MPTIWLIAWVFLLRTIMIFQSMISVLIYVCTICSEALVTWNKCFVFLKAIWILDYKAKFIQGKVDGLYLYKKNLWLILVVTFWQQQAVLRETSTLLKASTLLLSWNRSKTGLVYFQVWKSVDLHRQVFWRICGNFCHESNKTEKNVSFWLSRLTFPYETSYIVLRESKGE